LSFSFSFGKGEDGKMPNQCHSWSDIAPQLQELGMAVPDAFFFPFSYLICAGQAESESADTAPKMKFW